MQIVKRDKNEKDFVCNLNQIFDIDRRIMILFRICILFLFNFSVVKLHEIPDQRIFCQYEESLSINSFNICYANQIENRTILVWFTIEKSLNQTFDSYRFTRRNEKSIEYLTNFTSLIDRNNSLRMINFDAGQYEICIDFQSISPAFIYQPRNGCLRISFGQSTFESFHQSSTALFITLASGIVLFFLLGLIVQWAKGKRERQNKHSLKRERKRSSIISVRQQHDRMISNFFHRHFDQPHTTNLHQWARNRAFRHRISTQEGSFHQPNLIRRWSRTFFPSKTSIATISLQNLAVTNKDQQSTSFRKVSFDLV